MLNRRALLMSAGITMFVVALVAGIAAASAQLHLGATARPVRNALEDPAVQAALREREDALQRLIEEANRRLADAESRSSEPQGQDYPVSKELAMNLGRAALGGGALLRDPDLVNFGGRVAYELIFDRGQVYIDANTGLVLYSSAAGSVQASNPSGFGENEREDEHEGFDD
jgi:hypothetical protein